MIQANELRCGNTLHYTTAEGDVLPTTIDWQDIKWISEDQAGFNSVHSPITLTEEWLVRFGYKGLDQGYCLLSLTLLLSITKIDDKRFVLVDATTLRYKSSPFEYVHQFQNLIHALTGTELTEPKND